MRPQIKQLQENTRHERLLDIYTQEDLDEAELKIYWDKIRASFSGHQVKVLVNYGRHGVLEGDPVEGIVIAEFPNFEAAKAWYESLPIRPSGITASKEPSIAVWLCRACSRRTAHRGPSIEVLPGRRRHGAPARAAATSNFYDLFSRDGIAPKIHEHEYQ